MQRVTVLTVFALIGTSIASAGQIQIGGGTNGANGLTSAYIGAGAGSWVEQNYAVRLFQSATSSSTPVAPTYSTGSYAENTSPSAATINDTGTEALTDSATGVTFNMLSDGTYGTSTQYSRNFWEATNTSTLTIPVGVLDVSDVWTLMNNLWGTPNANNTTVTFNFGGSATVASESLIVALINSGDTTGGGATPSGQVATSVQCTTTVGGSPAACNTFAIGPTAASSSITTSGTAAGSLSAVTVLTDTLMAGSYNAAVGNFASSAGQVVMTDQGFQFGTAFNGLYLVSIQVADSSGAGHTSETALSAITVDSTPEPSTMWLLVTGFGAAGFARFRRKKN